MADIYSIFCDHIKENHIFNRSDHVIIGLSGGADSICLTVMLKKLSEEMELKLTCVHVNHQIRGLEADRDEAFVKEFCKKQGLPCVAVNAAVKSYAEKNSISLEEAGRIARYQTFAQVAKKIAKSGDIPDTIKAAVAHHMDDNAETILMNLVRGSGIRGLSGMKALSKRFNLWIARPMLQISRAGIEEYLKQEKIDFITDSTNNEDEYARNKVRLNVIPELNRINSKASKHITEAASAIEKAQAFIKKEAAKFIDLFVDDRDGAMYIDLDKFAPLDVVVKEQTVLDLIEKISESLKDISRVHVDSVLSLEELQTGRRVELPYGITASRSYSNIIIKKATEGDRLASDMTDYVRSAGKRLETGGEEGEPKEPEAFMIDPAQFSHEPVRYALWRGVEAEVCLVHVNPVTRQQLIAENKYTKAFDCAKIKGNLVFRKPDPHDEIQFFGGKKTVRKFFVDEKVPKEERSSVLSVCDGNDVMWLIGYRMSESYKITELTNLALKVSIIGGEDE